MARGRRRAAPLYTIIYPPPRKRRRRKFWQFWTLFFLETHLRFTRITQEELDFLCHFFDIFTNRLGF